MKITSLSRTFLRSIIIKFALLASFPFASLSFTFGAEYLARVGKDETILGMLDTLTHLAL